jgi:xanthine dehydrogenase/oxidase
MRKAKKRTLIEIIFFENSGTEMGQGLHTKMVSVAAEVLRCNVNKIRISETATDKVANTSPTAASASSDLNGMAIRIACEQIRERLNTLLVGDDINLSWKDLVKKAYLARIDLCAHGFYATPEPLGADFSQNRAHFNYFTQGTAVTEVELDTLTGDWHILRVDILMVNILRIILY